MKLERRNKVLDGLFEAVIELKTGLHNESGHIMDQESYPWTYLVYDDQGVRRVQD